MYSKVEVITPELAEVYLSRNIENNRRISNERISKYAEDMKSGNWQLTSQGITFNEDGKLTDGQHRLHAVIKSGVPVHMYVTYGESNSVFIHDRAASRTVSDVIYMSGVCKILNPTEQKLGISIAKLAFKFTKRGKNLSDTDCIDFVSKNEDSLKESIRISRIGYSHPLALSAPHQLAIFSAFISGESIENLERFTSAANSGFSNGVNESAAIVARNFSKDGWQKEFNGHYGDSARKRICEVWLDAIKDFCNEIPRKKIYSSKPLSNLPYINSVIDMISSNYL